MNITEKTLIEIEKYLKSEGIYFESVCQYQDTPAIEVAISWGDWNHDHLYLKHLMNQFGWDQIGEEETETDGSDCYSSNHYFMKKTA